MATRLWMATGLIVAMLSAHSSADVCTRRITEWGGFGKTTAVARNGQDLYFGGAVIRQARLDQPTLPVQSALVDLRSLVGSADKVTGIAFDGDLALVGLGRDGCALVDIGTPDGPTLVGSYSTAQTGWEVRAVAIMGTMGVVGLSKTHDASQSLLVQLDLSEPDAIAEMDSIEVGGQIQAAVVVGRYGLLISSGHQDPQTGQSRPAMLRSYDLIQWHGLVAAGAEQFPDAEPIAIDIEDDTAYLLDFSGGIHLVDLSAPEDPVKIDFIETPSMGWGGIDCLEDRAYVVGTNGLFVVELLAGTGEDRVTSLERGGLGPGIAAYDGCVYAAMGSEGIAVIDVESSDHPILLRSFGSARHVRHMAFDGEHVVLTDDSVEPAGRAEEVLYLLSQSPVDDFAEVKSGLPTGPVHGLALSDSRLIASISPGWEDGRCGLLPLEVDGQWESPTTDTFIDICPVRDGGRSVMDAAEGVFAVLADAGAEVHLFDLLEPAWTEVAGVWPASFAVSHIEVGDNRLALCRNSAAGAFVDVVDIADPSSPHAVGSVALTGTECLAMDAEGSRLVVATKVPAHPWGTFTDLGIVDLGTASLDRTIQKVADTDRVELTVGDDFVHVIEFAGNHAEHRVIDLVLTDPEVTNVHLRGTDHTVFAAHGSVLAWGKGSDGLEVLEFRSCTTPARDYSGGGRAGP